MNASPLDYRPGERLRFRLRLPWRISIGVVTALLAVLAGLLITVRTTKFSMDGITGSTMGQSVCFGFWSSTSVTPSPLEKRLKASGIAWTPAWQFMNENGSTIFGRTTYCGCGQTPAIFEMHAMLKEFADASSDEDLRSFVRVMQTGNSNQQQAAVDTASAKPLQAISAMH